MRPGISSPGWSTTVHHLCPRNSRLRMPLRLKTRLHIAALFLLLFAQLSCSKSSRPGSQTQASSQAAQKQESAAASPPASAPDSARKPAEPTPYPGSAEPPRSTAPASPPAGLPPADEAVQTAQAPPPPPEVLPRFPWPPPIPSARLSLPLDANPNNPTFGNLSFILDAALKKTGYFEKSYFSVPGGIAIVTRMERIYQDGTPVPVGRWSVEQPTVPRLSLSEYLRALFTASPGYYRMIVFVITDKPFGATNETISASTANRWLADGFNILPEDVLLKPLPPHFAFTALVYEFRREQGGKPYELEPSDLDARTHLTKCGLWAALHLQ